MVITTGIGRDAPGLEEANGQIDYALKLEGMKILGQLKVGFVSANSWDIQGAGAFGLRTCWLNRTGQAGDELGFAPEVVKKQLTELPEMIGSQASPTNK